VTKKKLFISKKKDMVVLSFCESKISRKSSTVDGRKATLWKEGDTQKNSAKTPKRQVHARRLGKERSAESGD